MSAYLWEGNQRYSRTRLRLVQFRWNGKKIPAMNGGKVSEECLGWLRNASLGNTYSADKMFSTREAASFCRFNYCGNNPLSLEWVHYRKHCSQGRPCDFWFKGLPGVIT